MLHQIGVGVLGPLFRTYEPSRDRLVAVKVFRLSVTPEQAGALAEELSRVVDVGLEHAAIVTPIAAGLTGMTPYLAQEYVTGETLDVAMRQYAPGPLETTLPFITQLASAIDYACAAGVSHGALHPRDVFLTPELARATGFGVVAALERVGLRGPVRRPYSAPERIAGEPWGPAADIFALAAIAFELLTGRRPAGTGEQVVALLGEIGGAADQPAFRRAFATALADDPAERYGSAQEFAHALAVAAGLEDPVAPGVAASERGPLEQTEERWAETLNGDQVDEPVPADVDRALPAPTAPFERQSAAAEPSLFDGIEEIEEIEQIEDLAEAPEVAAERRTPVEEGSVEYAADADDEAEAEDDSDIDQWPVEEPAAVSAEFAVSDHDDRVSRSAVVMPQPASREWPRRALLPLALTLAVVILVAFVANLALDTPDPVQFPSASAGQELPVSSAADIMLPSPSEPNLASPASPAGQESSDGIAVEVLDDLPVVPVPLAAPPVPPATSSPAPAVAPPSPLAPPPPASPQPSPGRLLVRSSPPGALVDVNGTPRGTTPLALGEIPYGSYTLRVSRPGYVSQVHELSISAGQPVGAVSVRLMPAATGAASPARAAGSVFVESRPPAAQVFLDGERVGRTPVLLSDVAAGLHEIRIQRDGYRVWSTTTRVVASERTRVGASLDRTARP